MTENHCEKLTSLHTSVLLHELVDSIEISQTRQNTIVDCTLGMGGHASYVIKKMNKGDVFIGFDADIRNLEIVKPYLEDLAKKQEISIFFINDNFRNLKSRLEEIGITKITGIYYDLGISSLHVDNADRGFSFKLDGPLDMRFDETKGIKASDIVNGYKKEELIQIFRDYGEEPASKKIAEAILTERKTGFRFHTTKELSDLITKISRDHKARNRIFQALRIETNDELGVIKGSISDAISLLEESGDIFVISFHSLEDRIIKNIFKDESRDCICKDLICSCKHKKQLNIMTKKPIIPTDEEIKNNPRSRSAKARYAKKLK